jgi:glycosyltransferase involved in cell wall biosynthesis
MGDDHKKIKLLITTQKVDINDPLLGFFHGWLKKFAEKFDLITVICLQKGKYNLPNNVKVLSLGKEKYSHHSHAIRRLVSLYNFYKYILRERRNYDAVFVHMNPIYVILGHLLWKSWNKKICLWYNHRYGNWITKTAIKMANFVFYTSPFSFAPKFKKAKIMPAGIDTNIFKSKVKSPANLAGRRQSKVKNSILYLGRISSIKNLDVLIEAVKILEKKGVDFILNIAGDIVSNKDIVYFKKIKEISQNLEKKGKIRFLGEIPPYKTVEIYNQNEIFINLTNPGSLDKTTLEAMACETLVIVSNRFFWNILPKELIFKEQDREDLAKKLESVFKWQAKDKEIIVRKLRNFVVENQSLDKLVFKITDLIK